MAAKSSAPAIIAVLGAILAPPLIATAAPPGFPDLSAFSSVDPRSYLRITNDGRPGGGSNSVTWVYFSTSDAVQCQWLYVPDALQNVTTNTEITCSGNIPGIPDSVPDNGGPGCARVGPATVLSPEFALGGHGAACPPFNAVALDPGHKIETANTTCVVGAGSLIACIDPATAHGFVLQPSGSSVF